MSYNQHVMVITSELMPGMSFPSEMQWAPNALLRNWCEERKFLFPGKTQRRCFFPKVCFADLHLDPWDHLAPSEPVFSCLCQPVVKRDVRTSDLSSKACRLDCCVEDGYQTQAKGNGREGTSLSFLWERWPLNNTPCFAYYVFKWRVHREIPAGFIVPLNLGQAYETNSESWFALCSSLRRFSKRKV